MTDPNDDTGPAQSIVAAPRRDPDAEARATEEAARMCADRRLAADERAEKAEAEAAKLRAEVSELLPMLDAQALAGGVLVRERDTATRAIGDVALALGLTLDATAEETVAAAHDLWESRGGAVERAERAEAALSRVLVAALGCECQDGHACHVHGAPLDCVDGAVQYLDDVLAHNNQLADAAECIHSRLTEHGIEEHESGVSRVGPGEGSDPGPRRDLLERVDMLLEEYRDLQNGAEAYHNDRLRDEVAAALRDRDHHRSRFDRLAAWVLRHGGDAALDEALRGEGGEA